MKSGSLIVSFVLFFALTFSSSAQERRNTYSLEESVGNRHSVLSVSTNLLYDALMVPNVGLEFNVFNNWTVSVNGMWAWWTSEKINWFWRVYGGDVAVKKYFGRRPAVRSMTGHHLGLYGQALSYDLSIGHFGIMVPDLSYGGGLEYGYSFPVSNAFNIDVSFGLGYLGSRFYEYVENDGHYVWQSTVQNNWFGPTKLGITLVWLIDSKKRI